MAKILIESTPDLSKARDRRMTFAYNYDEIVIPQSVLEYAKGRTYFIHTYGCQANYVDEENMSGMLEKAGLTKASEIEKADVIILNTCAVRENAEQKVFGQIGNLKAVKQADKTKLIAVCGCMVQQKHIIDFVLDKYKHVDLIFGTHNIQELPQMMAEVIEKNVRLVNVKSSSDEIKENLPNKRLSSYKAFVNIAYGCDKFCTYCIVPYTRGKERSRKMEDILKECLDLKNKGYKEITLLGQNVNSYGKDFKDGTTFAKLLGKVAELGIPRVRFLTSHPWDFSLELIDTIAKYDNICKYIHLPVQSGSSEVLKLMNRKYTAETYKKLVDTIRERIPGVALSTDIIVGFPNETYEQFLETVEMVKYVKYESAFTFIYSPRKGTPAAAIEDNVAPKEKSKRFQELVKELEKVIKPSSDAMIGKTYDVLVDGPSEKNPEFLSGYTEKNKLVHFKGDISLVGEIVKVKINESHLYSLIGELVNE